jgi:DNA-directed RNA polymerase subunit H (RpoH/RPB5)
MEDKALTTISEMIASRGSNNTGIINLGSLLDDTRMYSIDNHLIIFCTKTRCSERDLLAYIQYLTENPHTSLIIVTLSGSSEKVLKTLCDHLSTRDTSYVQLFNIRNLQFNYSQHVKVPRHRIVGENEISEILKTTQCKTPELFRKIWCQDPMAKWIGARPSDIIEVTGMCMTSAENKHYLYCIAEL